ncbi:MAG: tetratricopeptide repeat protein [Planctomycetes bacterium]|nr:tetratricopeptide repeat protein [Planctomycetota bacterium]
MSRRAARALLMAAGLAACAWIAAAPAWADESSRTRTFVQGLEAFDKAKTPAEFAHAAALFESLLADGYQNGAVLYNLGNAYMRAGQVARAIAAYRRAQRLRPRDPYLEYNLQSALATAPGHYPEAKPPWWKHVLFLHDSMSQEERQQAAVGCFALLFVLASLRLLAWRRTRMHPGLHGAMAVAAALLLVAGASAVLGYQEDVQAEYGVVLETTVARLGPGEDYKEAFVKALQEGAEFELVESRGDWVLARLPGVGEGWLLERNVLHY